MIREETIKHFESLQKRYTTQHNGKHCEYVKEALEAMKKQIPQKPIGRDLWELATATGHSCPSCGNDFPIGICKPYKYCPDCGQAIKREDEI